MDGIIGLSQEGVYDPRISSNYYRVMNSLLT